MKPQEPWILIVTTDGHHLCGSSLEADRVKTTPGGIAGVPA